MNRRNFIIAIFFYAALSLGCDEAGIENSAVRTGAEILIENHLDELSGKRVGLVMNPTARIGDTHMLDTLLSREINITALFAPEHGFRGEAGAGERIEDGIDRATGLPVFSLYGSTRKPTPEMLEHVDLLLFDMQDVGARFYTYIATLGLVMEAAAEAELPVWILDRPNPLGGDLVSGWMMEEQHKSFVGPYPIPILHGLTMGEMAAMIAGENWMEFENEPEIRVIKMNGWSRDMKWPDTSLDWIPPSPNLGTFAQTFIYPGTVFLEGTSMSEGRGTDEPFLLLGDPSINPDLLDIDRLNELSDGFSVEPAEFTPRSIPGVAPNPKHLGEHCYGIRIRVHHYDFDPVKAGLAIFKELLEAAESKEMKPFLYLLTGSELVDRYLQDETELSELQFEPVDFMEQRRPYLLYE